MLLHFEQVIMSCCTYFVALLTSLEYIQSVGGEQLIILEYILINFEINTLFCFFCASSQSIFDILVFLVVCLH